jgi:hypothetical protein
MDSVRDHIYVTMQFILEFLFVWKIMIGLMGEGVTGFEYPARQIWIALVPLSHAIYATTYSNRVSSVMVGWGHMIGVYVGARCNCPEV